MAPERREFRLNQDFRERETPFSVRTPEILRLGDTVGIVAPSEPPKKSNIVKSTRILEDWGLNVQLAGHIGENTYGFSAGPPETVAKDIIDLVKDPEIKAIHCTAGGDAIFKIFGSLKDYGFFKELSKNPKIIIGYSEVDAILLAALIRSRVTGLHAPNFEHLHLRNQKTLESLRRALFERKEPFLTIKKNRGGVFRGEGEGRLIVANMRTWTHLTASGIDPLREIPEPIILALEEYGRPTTILRRLSAIASHDDFRSKVKGLILHPRKWKEDAYPDYWKREYRESFRRMVTEDVFKTVDIPIAFLPNFGHTLNGETMLTLPVGWPVELTVGKTGRTTLKFAKSPNGRIS